MWQEQILLEKKYQKTPNTKGVVFELLGCLLKNKSFKELWVLWVSKLNHKIEEAGKKKKTHTKKLITVAERTCMQEFS